MIAQMKTDLNTSARPVGVDELRRAWLAVQAGHFRQCAREPQPETSNPSAPAGVWTPAAGELVVPVVGASGCCGATTVSLALATAAGRRARVVESTSASRSGLVAASARELGSENHGWAHGVRDQVLLDRGSGEYPSPDNVPTPPPADSPLVTVVDVGGQVEQVVAGHGWLTRLLAEAPTVVLVARASVPGLRRLECCLLQLDAERTVVTVVGPSVRHWPRLLSHSMGPLTAGRVDSGRLVDIPEDRGLALRGLTPDPLPARLLAHAAALLPLIKGN